MPFEKGKSGNPGGRPKGGMELVNSLTDELEKDNNTDKIARTLIDMALKKNIHAIKYIYDRVVGTPRSSMDLNHSGDLGVTINIPTELLPNVKKDENE